MDGCHLREDVAHTDTRFRSIFFYVEYLGTAFCDQTRAVGKIFASLVETWRLYSKNGMNCLKTLFLFLMLEKMARAMT